MKKKVKSLKTLPLFKSEKEEKKFWETHDSAEYIDWKKAKKATFQNLKPSTQSISIRLPSSLLEEIKIKANKRDVPYQSFIKILLSEGLKKAS
ncbi:MAG TPA: BrnA antitoxin family protein [Pseudobdellovibrionaceae bacterium]|nr:BrnA antitoxin family protein [Pseudobdellovibrionaceae bacterium]